jgi:NAD(P)-dependent dehydrogenase (short-subunit alcohol dehydrogenase family)
MDLKNKVAVITGGGKRVGRVITLELARAGANVVVNFSSSADEAIATAAEAEALGVEAMTVQADVGDLSQVKTMAEVTAARFGGADILVNNASIFRAAPFPTDDHSVWHRSIDTLVHGPYYCVNEIAPQMLARGGGAIVSIGDLSAFEPWPRYTGHSIGKAAVIALTHQFALELAPTVRVNAVVPGPTLRPHDYDDARYERVAADTLLGRWGTPEDIAGAVRFLIEAEYITGEVLTVDGGQRYARRRDEAG